MVVFEINKRLTEFEVVQIEEKHFNDLYKLQLTNPKYFSNMQDHEVTFEECINGTSVLPPNIEMDQKYYLGFYRNDKLNVIADIITGFPKDNVVWIGLLMVDSSLKRKGLGRKTLNAIIEVTSSLGYESLQIGVLENNSNALEFWKAMNFKEIRRNLYDKEKNINVVVMELVL